MSASLIDIAIVNVVVNRLRNEGGYLKTANHLVKREDSTNGIDRCPVAMEMTQKTSRLPGPDEADSSGVVLAYDARYGPMVTSWWIPEASQHMSHRRRIPEAPQIRRRRRIKKETAGWGFIKENKKGLLRSPLNAAFLLC